MTELDRTAWAKEAQRVEKQIAHRKDRARDLEREIRDLEARRDALLKKIADDYNEEN